MIRFTIHAAPHGKKTGRPNPRAKRVFTPKETLAYQNTVGQVCADVMRRHGIRALDGALRVTITARFAIPKSASKAKRAAMLAWVDRPTKKPDASNIAKAVEDGMKGIAFADDAQVCELSVIKLYALHEGVDVVVERVGEVLGTAEAGRVCADREVR